MREITEAAERLRAYLDNRNPYTTYRGKPPEGAPQLRIDIKTLIAALASDAKGAGLVAVKPLEWRDSDGCSYAESSIGTYEVSHYGEKHRCVYVKFRESWITTRPSDIPAAKAAAQAHKDQLIRSEIVDPPAALGDLDAAAKRITTWRGSNWESLPDGSIVDKGYPIFSHSLQGGWRFQGCKDDMRKLISEVVALAGPAALGAGSAPEGWVLVPREPTAEMISAYCEAQNNLGIAAFANARVIWPAMLAVAPAAPGEAP